MVTTTLQNISDIIDDEFVSVILLIGDSSMHRGKFFFNPRLCASYCSDLTNLHLVVVPMFECHIVKNMFNMVVKFFDTLYSWWREKLIGVSSDGEITMTSCHSGFVMCMV